jgi:hypothetical protein
MITAKNAAPSGVGRTAGAVMPATDFTGFLKLFMPALTTN